MTFSYTSPSTSNGDAVRFLIGDTVTPGDASNEEIAYALTVSATVGGAALIVARALYAKYAKEVTKAVGDLRLSLSDKAKTWALVIEQLEDNAALSDTIQVYAGGQSDAEKDLDEADTDLPQPRATVGMHDFQAQAEPYDWDPA